MKPIKDLYCPKSCRHNQEPKQPGGLALVTIGNPLRADDGIGMAVCDALPPDILNETCRFDLGSFTYFLIDCMVGHKSAIVIDSTMSENPAGSVIVLDLAEVLSARSPLKLHFSHGFSLLDELRVGQWRGLLPEKLFFVGIEAASTDWSERLSGVLTGKMPELVSEVSKIIEMNLERKAQYA